MSFWCLQFLPKNEENKSTWGIIVVKSNSFVRFLEETSAWKKSFRLCLTFRKHSWQRINGLNFFFLLALFSRDISSIFKYYESFMESWNCSEIDHTSEMNSPHCVYSSLCTDRWRLYKRALISARLANFHIDRLNVDL